MLREKIKKQLKELNIKQYLNFNITTAEKKDKNKIYLSDLKNNSLVLTVDLIVNCTYTYSNNLLKIFGINTNLTEYEFEETEIAVVETDINLPALTVMDGPYITILPYGGHKNKFLVYDVVNSVINKEYGLFFKKNNIKKNNWDKMMKHGLKYYPFFDKVEYKYSLYSNRPIPSNNQNDSRTTRIIKENYDIDFFSIKEGKFISAPAIAVEFNRRVNNYE